jgi:UDP-N-acetylmuramate dehydrogenase
MKIQENISLKKWATFRTGGNARYFVRVKNTKELKEALGFSQRSDLRNFVLGKGANTLVSDQGYFGLIIRMEIKGILIDEKSKNAVRVTVGAGEDWDTLVGKMVRRKFTGLENLSYIPGTVGAAAFGNIGAYGVEAKDIISSVEALNTETMKIKKFSNEECAFGYRESFFKTKDGNKYIITKVIFDLKKNGMLKTDYKDVQEYFEKKKIISPTSKNLRDAIIEIRKNKLPDIAIVGTAGSFFKNPIVSKRKAEELKKEYPGLPLYFSAEGKTKLPAGYLLDRICGIKGYKKGNVGTWEKQALCLVNYGNATTKEILEFAEEVKEKVQKKTGIVLEMEVQIL